MEAQEEKQLTLKEEILELENNKYEDFIVNENEKKDKEMVKIKSFKFITHNWIEDDEGNGSGDNDNQEGNSDKNSKSEEENNNNKKTKTTQAFEELMKKVDQDKNNQEDLNKKASKTGSGKLEDKYEYKAKFNKRRKVLEVKKVKLKDTDTEKEEIIF